MSLLFVRLTQLPSRDSGHHTINGTLGAAWGWRPSF